ncbi:hypothetical protein L596_019403 [Steinernema carpocapsae]|uniref:Uncharacterized protein n=1 Tax=Steinernema carpocapsae TaxID=34508 RepID=A0A4U5MQF4_STECR|nr:hypothetical protein L596_019403 [Steinernema carpocapsae]
MKPNLWKLPFCKLTFLNALIDLGNREQLLRLRIPEHRGRRLLQLLLRARRNAGFAWRATIPRLSADLQHHYPLSLVSAIHHRLQLLRQILAVYGLHLSEHAALRRRGFCLRRSMVGSMPLSHAAVDAVFNVNTLDRIYTNLPV